ncbi:TPM domain-containing protein [Acinetobacter faecalis]|uniref:TPM domain-containing protein n=1 Tax=Acinetobacter faecalis TaxID=2665161 RepID=UPI002A919ED6|nr:TPM domain-containing protein [Acinetobacter faecalis]MDY6536466.1 TPM domain-containing protein [Acinetobacter faecalis]
MIDSEKSFPIAKFIQLIILSCMMLFSFSAWSETATATDESTDVIVAGKIIQNQQKLANSQNVEQENVQPLQVENDLADGESIRTLPTLNEPVIDQANILSASEKQQISTRILKLNEQAKAQIGVVIVPTTGQEDIFDFTMRVAEQWKLGSEKQDNGLLMAIAINDRRIQIATGYGLEGILPDIVASRIIRNNITPYFKQNQFAQGVDAGLAEIENILNMDPEIAEQAALELKERQEQALHEQQGKEKTFNTALIILIAGIIGSFVVGKRLSASTAAVAGTVAGLVNGAGLLTSLLIGGGIFFLLITTIAQVLFQAVLSGSGGRGGGSGGGFGGGGYRGGGGGFGGGGASGSW